MALLDNKQAFLLIKKELVLKSNMVKELFSFLYKPGAINLYICINKKGLPKNIAEKS